MARPPLSLLAVVAVALLAGPALASDQEFVGEDVPQHLPGGRRLLSDIYFLLDNAADGKNARKLSHIELIGEDVKHFPGRRLFSDQEFVGEDVHLFNGRRLMSDVRIDGGKVKVFPGRRLLGGSEEPENAEDAAGVGSPLPTTMGSPALAPAPSAAAPVASSLVGVAVAVAGACLLL